jgi:hypothetical protein
MGSQQLTDIPAQIHLKSKAGRMFVRVPKGCDNHWWRRRRRIMVEYTLFQDANGRTALLFLNQWFFTYVLRSHEGISTVRCPTSAVARRYNAIIFQSEKLGLNKGSNSFSKPENRILSILSKT